MEIPIKVLIQREPDGGYSAEVPGMPGCITEGDTLEDLTRNLREAIEGWFGATQDEVIARAKGEPEGDQLEVITL